FFRSSWYPHCADSNGHHPRRGHRRRPGNRSSPRFWRVAASGCWPRSVSPTKTVSTASSWPCPWSGWSSVESPISGGSGRPTLLSCPEPRISEPTAQPTTGLLELGHEQEGFHDIPFAAHPQLPALLHGSGSLPDGDLDAACRSVVAGARVDLLRHRRRHRHRIPVPSPSPAGSFRRCPRRSLRQAPDPLCDPDDGGDLGPRARLHGGHRRGGVVDGLRL